MTDIIDLAYSWQEIPSTKYPVIKSHHVKKEIDKENQVLVMCAAGGRSTIAANLLQNEGYKAHNISDGFSGNGQDLGWKNSGLPTN